MMRHHDREILSSSFPGKEGSDAIDVESTLAHVDKFHGKPETSMKCYFTYKARHFKHAIWFHADLSSHREIT